MPDGAENLPGLPETTETFASRLSAACAPVFDAFGGRSRHPGEPDLDAYCAAMGSAARIALGIVSVGTAITIWHFVSYVLSTLEPPSSLADEDHDLLRQSLFAALDAASDSAISLPASDTAEAQARIVWYRRRFEAEIAAPEIERQFFSRVAADFDVLQAAAAVAAREAAEPDVPAFFQVPARRAGCPACGAAEDEPCDAAQPGGWVRIDHKGVRLFAHTDRLRGWLSDGAAPDRA